MLAAMYEARTVMKNSNSVSSSESSRPCPELLLWDALNVDGTFSSHNNYCTFLIVCKIMESSFCRAVILIFKSAFIKFHSAQCLVRVHYAL